MPMSIVVFIKVPSGVREERWGEEEVTLLARGGRVVVAIDHPDNCLGEGGREDGRGRGGGNKACGTGLRVHCCCCCCPALLLLMHPWLLCNGGNAGFATAVR